QVVFKKPILEVHGPVKTQFGFHLIKTLYRN
ncbi:MAG: peptidylprolyl isomerase, partial [Paraglaciecola sp.]|nr:peptidylprolyl isomerase [Paraglaciecola sp.]